MPYLNVDLDYFEHPKTLRLVGLLGKGTAEIPIRLWAKVGKHHSESGTLAMHSAQEIESLVGWRGEVGKCVEALVKVGFLEPLPAGQEGFQVHDWKEHEGHIFALKLKAQAASNARWERMRKETMPGAMPGASPEHSPGYPPYRTKPNRTGKETTTASAGDLAAAPPSQDGDGFAAWWAVWPNKTAKAAAGKAWKRLQPSSALQDALRAAVAAQTVWRASLTAAGAFAPAWPHPATWLNGRRWEDELPVPAAPTVRPGIAAVDGPPLGEPYKPVTPTQRVVCLYKLLKGLDMKDRAWDAAQWRAIAPEAERLLAAFDGRAEEAAPWLEAWAAARAGKTWALSWATKDAWDSKAEREAGKEDPEARRGGRRVATGAELAGQFLREQDHFEEEHH